jgi:hypothetical protein
MKTQLKTGLTCFCLAWLLGWASPVLAVDGVIEINQARALAGDVTPGDTAGFPVTISETGSYRLTGNLTVDNADTNVIEVEASQVTIDLNGFALIGVTDCDYSSSACTNTGSGNGIEAILTGVENVTVKNGTVSGMGSTGVELLSGGRIENVSASDNGFQGLKANKGIIRDSVVMENGSFGIIGSYGLIVNCTATNNLGVGIYGGLAIHVINCNVSANKGYGLDLISATSSPASYSGCTMQANNGGNTPSDQVDGGIQVGENLCGTSLCP